MCNWNLRREESEWGRRNIWRNNGPKFSKINQRFQSTDPRSSEDMKQDKNKHTKYPKIKSLYSNYWKQREDDFSREQKIKKIIARISVLQ